MFDNIRMKRLLAVHGWSGAILGWLLYAVILTGAVAVFAHEIGTWSKGGQVSHAPLEGPVDAIVRELAREVDATFHEEVFIEAEPGGALRLFFHDHRMIDGELMDYGVGFRVDPETGAVLFRKEADGVTLHHADRSAALEHFLVDLHVRLHVPGQWGLFLTGVLGLAMMAAAISGLILHRHVIRDLFVAERPGRRLVSQRDRHVLAGSWGLPFAFLLAFTGTFFSFAGAVGLPILAMVAYGGDQMRMIETIVGHREAEDPTPAPLASLDYLIADSVERAGTAAQFVVIERYGRADAQVTVFHEHPQGALSGIRHQFDGPTRRFEGELPSLGRVPSAGSAAFSLMEPLHFGSFAGVPSKAVWAALGGAMAFVALSGLRLWSRRREGEPGWRSYAAGTDAIAWGLPFAMAASAWGFFLALPAGDPAFWTAVFFLAASAAAIFARIRLGARFEPVARRALGFALALLPLVRLLAGGASWGEALVEDLSYVVSVDLLLVFGGGLLLARRARPAALTAPAE